MNGSPRVLQLITESHPFGGAQRYVYQLLSALHDRFDLHLVCGGSGDLVAAALTLGVPVTVIRDLDNGHHPARDLRALLAIRRLIRQHQFDVVHTHSTKAGLLGRFAARLAGAPHILHTVHGSPFLGGDRPLVRRLSLLGEKAAARWTRLLLPVGEAVADEYLRAGIAARSRMLTIHGGVDFEQLDRAGDGLAARRELGLNRQHKVVLAVGHLVPAKGYFYLIEAASQVCAKRRRARFLIAGEGPLHEPLTRYLSQAGLDGRFLLLGARDDVPTLLAMADVFVLPSLWEGLQRSLIEAMHLRKPVVASAIGGAQELVVEGKTGRLVKPADPAALASAILDLLSAPESARTLGEAARARVYPALSAQVMVDRIMRIYESVLNGESVTKLCAASAA